MLSVVIITKNEAHTIAACCESVQWADEIIVIDSHSSDGTADIARTYTPHVFIEDWHGFGTTKNSGIAKAQHEWILSIDADERVTRALHDEIIACMHSPEHDGYYIPRLLYFCGYPVRHGGCYPDFQLRLFKKDKGCFNNVPVHEKVEVQGTVGHLRSQLLHFSYTSMTQYWERFNRYTSLDAEKKQQHGKRFHATSVLILPWEIFKRLWLKGGILDGIPGVFYHIFSAVSSLVKYAKLWEKEKQCHYDT